MSLFQVLLKAATVPFKWIYGPPTADSGAQNLSEKLDSDLLDPVSMHSSKLLCLRT